MGILTQAFDPKVLGERLKRDLLPVAEKAARITTNTLLTWVQESASLQDKAWLRVSVPLMIESLRPQIMAAIDRIDSLSGSASLAPAEPKEDESQDKSDES